MNQNETTTISTEPFTTPAGYTAARNELRSLVSDAVNIPAKQIRMSAGAVRLQAHMNGSWVTLNTDAAKYQADDVRIRSDYTFRLAIVIR